MDLTVPKYHVAIAWIQLWCSCGSFLFIQKYLPIKWHKNIWVIRTEAEVPQSGRICMRIRRVTAYLQKVTGLGTNSKGTLNGGRRLNPFHHSVAVKAMVLAHVHNDDWRRIKPYIPVKKKIFFDSQMQHSRRMWGQAAKRRRTSIQSKSRVACKFGTEASAVQLSMHLPPASANATAWSQFRAWDFMTGFWA